MKKDSKNFVLQIINLLRPKFHNHITWSIVLAGLALITTPLYQQILIALIEKYVGVQLPDENLVGLGISLVIIGLVYHVLMTIGYDWLMNKNSKLSEQQTIAIQQERIDHDKGIFQQADDIMSGTFIHDFLDRVGATHSFRHDDYDLLRNYCHFLALDENQFLAPELQDVTQKLLRSSLKFLNFLDVRFFIFPDRPIDDMSRSAMQPEQNIDRSTRGVTSEDVEFYDSITVELNGLISDLHEKYRLFRAKIKDILIL